MNIRCGGNRAIYTKRNECRWRLSQTFTECCIVRLRSVEYKKIQPNHAPIIKCLSDVSLIWPALLSPLKKLQLDLPVVMPHTWPWMSPQGDEVVPTARHGSRGWALGRAPTLGTKFHHSRYAIQ